METLVINVGGTTAAFPYADYYDPYHLGPGTVLHSCRLCAAVTLLPGPHLQYHVQLGHLQPIETPPEGDHVDRQA